MSFVAVAITGAVLSAGVGVTGAVLGANAAGNAAKVQQQSSANALDFQKQVYNTQVQNEQPYINAGQSNLATLQSDMPSLTQGFDPTKAGLPAQFSFNGTDLGNTPGYKFAIDQGNQAIQNSTAAAGGDASGAAMKQLDAFNVGEADQNYNNVFAQQQGTYAQNYGNAFNAFETNQGNTFNRLSSLVNMGQTANGQLAGAAQNFGNNASNIAIGSGNAQAAGIIGQANAWSNGLSTAGNGISNGLMLQGLIGNGMQSNGQGGTLGTSFNNMANTSSLSQMANGGLLNPNTLGSPSYNPAQMTQSGYTAGGGGATTPWSTGV